MPDFRLQTSDLLRIEKNISETFGLRASQLSSKIVGEREIKRFVCLTTPNWEGTGLTIVREREKTNLQLSNAYELPHNFRPKLEGKRNKLFYS